MFSPFTRCIEVRRKGELDASTLRSCLQIPLYYVPRVLHSVVKNACIPIIVTEEADLIYYAFSPVWVTRININTTINQALVRLQTRGNQPGGKGAITAVEKRQSIN